MIGRRQVFGVLAAAPIAAKKAAAEAEKLFAGAGGDVVNLKAENFPMPDANVPSRRQMCLGAMREAVYEANRRKYERRRMLLDMDRENPFPEKKSWSRRFRADAWMAARLELERGHDIYSMEWDELLAYARKRGLSDTVAALYRRNRKNMADMDVPVFSSKPF